MGRVSPGLGVLAALATTGCAQVAAAAYFAADGSDSDHDGAPLAPGGPPAPGAPPPAGAPPGPLPAARALFEDSGQRIALSQVAGGLAGDLDRDGDLDLLMRFHANVPPRVLLNAGGGRFQLGPELPAGRLVTELVLGDLDGDGDLDAALATDGDGTQVWLNGGEGAFARGARLVLPSGSRQALGLVAGDLDRDGDLDLVSAEGFYPVPRVWLNAGNATFALLADGSGETYTGEAPYFLAMADFDRDGDPDVVGTSAFVRHLIYLHAGAGSLSDSAQRLGAGGVSQVRVLDVDRDGDPDLVDDAVQSPRVWRNDGAGRFSDAGPAERGYLQGSWAGDFDLDGDDDLVSPRGEGVVLLRGGPAGLEAEQVDLPRGGTFHSFTSGGAVCDVDGDGDLDLILQEAISGSLWVARNTRRP